jgi:molybdopterin-containing oxidoreductase family iron-sulfur binding subunit
MGTVMDETAELADVILPIDSPLEQWGDYVPYTDVHCIMQPAMRRLYDTRLPGDIVMSISADAGRPLSRKDGQSPPVDFREWLRLRWEEEILPKAQGLEGEDKWMAVLRVGVVIALPQEPEAATQPTTEPTTQPTTNPTPTNVYDVRDHMTVIPDFPKPVIDLEQGRRATPPGPREAWLWAYPSIMWFDGRTANRGWLQEAPDPVSYATWGSWIDIHPDKAKALGLVDNQVVRLESPVGKLEAPLRVTDQVSPDTVAIALGQGHTAAGMKTACGVGANPFLLIAPGLAGPTKVTIVGTDRKSPPVYTSATQDQHDRDILQWVSLAKVGQGPTEKFRLPLPSDYDPQHNIFDPHQKYARRWAMVIDLHKCIGCGACAVACYAENNISVMGAKWVDEGREMAWLKIVPYREKEESGRLGWLPMLCQQCDSAPCEPVCPVFASVHNFEGLNAQVYNRCIGTRYCNNNCPYKVRRFNWFDTNWEKPLDMQLNPDVTVRCRGVMEKCNFCIQRIRAVEIQAKVEGRAVRDEEVRLLPACAMSCPTRAIQLGDLMDRNSEVYKLTTTEARRYHVLEELNTKSAVTYLKRIKAD